MKVLPSLALTKKGCDLLRLRVLDVRVVSSKVDVVARLVHGGYRHEGLPHRCHLEHDSPRLALP
eukprot:15834795-Heterocapsa_arctica.AAC.1